MSLKNGLSGDRPKRHHHLRLNNEAYAATGSENSSSRILTSGVVAVAFWIQQERTETEEPLRGRGPSCPRASRRESHLISAVMPSQSLVRQLPALYGASVPRKALDTSGYLIDVSGLLRGWARHHRCDEGNAVSYGQRPPSSPRGIQEMRILN